MQFFYKGAKKWRERGKEMGGKPESGPELTRGGTAKQTQAMGGH